MKPRYREQEGLSQTQAQIDQTEREKRHHKNLARKVASEISRHEEHPVLPKNIPEHVMIMAEEIMLRKRQKLIDDEDESARVKRVRYRQTEAMPKVNGEDPVIIARTRLRAGEPVGGGEPDVVLILPPAYWENRRKEHEKVMQKYSPTNTD